MKQEVSVKTENNIKNTMESTAKKTKKESPAKNDTLLKEEEEEAGWNEEISDDETVKPK
jgi:hypothetical protein